ncbi:MAG: transcriptional regulator, LacI family [Glaciihabitans sp.]|nr:transcriptional regulator, LacI family [Glaciihabitans sp.]
MNTPSPAGEPTLEDVAKYAGVSIATASRALSGSRHVSPERAKRVAEASRAVGYRHNAVASALRSKRTETVGLVLPRYSTAFLSALMESVSSGLNARGISLVLRYSEPDAIHDHDNVEFLLSRRVDGIILCPPSELASRESVAAAGSVPVVQVGRFIDTDRTDSVGLDEDGAMSLTISHLVERGVRRITTIGMMGDEAAFARRLEALVSAAARFGMEVEKPLPGDPTLAGGIEGAEHLLPDLDGIDAIVCGNDDVALGALAVFKLHKIRVPEDLQVMSVLDVQYTDVPNRAVTTLRHPWPAMGREAVRLLLDARSATADGTPRRMSLAPQVIQGRSTRELEPSHQR